mmetsp:Transcript_3287/g.6575  ORF Transcript_3287/g.6575 Transcript_3287/m.6575 type:complete len:189 (-) Transcript_3287:76-642(-)
MSATVRFFTSVILLHLLWRAETSLSSSSDNSHLDVLDTDWTVWAHPPILESNHGWKTILGRQSKGVLSRIVFRYDMPHLDTYDTNQMAYKIWLGQHDCEKSPVDKALTWSHTAKDGKLDIKVHVNSDLIQASPYWTLENQGTGFLDFCVRVDVIYQRESRNFHESPMHIQVDPSKGFHLVEIQSRAYA